MSDPTNSKTTNIGQMCYIMHRFRITCQFEDQIVQVWNRFCDVTIKFLIATNINRALTAINAQQEIKVSQTNKITTHRWWHCSSRQARDTGSAGSLGGRAHSSASACRCTTSSECTAHHSAGFATSPDPAIGRPVDSCSLPKHISQHHSFSVRLPQSSSSSPCSFDTSCQMQPSQWI